MKAEEEREKINAIEIVVYLSFNCSREFLRLGDPLCGISLDDTEPNKPRGGPVPLTRIKTLVSMTTPKDFRAHGSCTLPPFVELDMSAEGFACLYLPSVAPQSTTPPTVVVADNSVLGGIGSGKNFTLR